MPLMPLLSGVAVFFFHVEKPTTYYQTTDEQLAAMLDEEKTPNQNIYTYILLWGK